MNTRWLTVLASAGLLVSAGQVLAQAEKKPVKEVASFGTLRAPSDEAARSQALEWLKNAGKTDEASLKAFAVIWDQTDAMLIEKVAETFSLGDAAAKKLLTQAGDSESPAPTALPEIFKDTKLPAYFRINLTLAYAKALSSRRAPVYEESLEALRTIKPEQVVDPATYLFLRAVAEHGTLQKREASESIVRLLDDVTDAPERYRAVAALMIIDLLTWKDKDLNDIARQMDYISKRLDLQRGGDKTQQMEKKVIARLDEIIKRVENQQKQDQQQASSPDKQQGDQECPSPGNQQMPSNNIQSTKGKEDSDISNGAGPGVVDPKQFKKLTENWGTLPEKERARAMRELSRSMPAEYQEIIESYYKRHQQKSDPNKP